MQNQTPENSAAASKPGLITRILGWFWGVKDGTDHAHPIKRTLLVLLFVGLGVGISEAYQWGKGKLVDPDEYLKEVEKKHLAAFNSLEEGLRQIRGSIDSGDRAAFKQVSGAVKELQSINTGLLGQLSLAKQENERLSRISQQAGISGGYDFILSEHSGLRIDPNTQIGIASISSNGAQVRVSAEGADNGQTFLNAGESIAYRSAAGQSCKVTLLSVSGGSSASFALSCENTTRA